MEKNTDKLMPQSQVKICYPCIISKFDSEDFLKEDLKKILKQLREHRIRNY
jgi:predicted metal-dependent hydrolase